MLAFAEPQPPVQRRRCVCPCRSLDCVQLSDKPDKRASAYRTFGWTQRQKVEFDAKIVDGIVKPKSVFVARGHFEPGDLIVRGAAGARLQPVRGLGHASFAFVPAPASGAGGVAGRYSPSAVPASTPQTADRRLSASAEAAQVALDVSIAGVSQDAEATVEAASGTRRELEMLTAENARLRREVLELAGRLEAAKGAPVWRRVGLRRRRRDGSPGLGYLSPCMRWERVREAPERELKSLIGFSTAAQFEAFVRWLDADGLLTEATLVSTDAGRAAVRKAGALAPPSEHAGGPAYVPITHAERSRGGRPRELSTLDWSFLCIFIVRQNVSQAHAAYTFGISDAQVSAYFSTWFCLVDAWLDVQMPVPSAELLAATTPPAWTERIGSNRPVVVIDATPVRTASPKDGVRNAQLFGQYYSGTAVKVQVVTNALGAAVHVTSGVGGSISDDTLAAFSAVATALPPGTTILADRGYVQLATNGDLLSKGSCLLRPQFRTAHDASGESVLTAAQVSSTANIANMRSVVERVNGAAKSIFPWLCRKHHLQQLDIVVVVVRVLFRFASFWPVLLDVTQTLSEPPEDEGASPRAKRRRTVRTMRDGRVHMRIFAGTDEVQPPRTPRDAGAGAGVGPGDGADTAGAGAGGGARMRSASRGNSARRE